MESFIPHHLLFIGWDFQGFFALIFSKASLAAFFTSLSLSLREALFNSWE
jgi:hypothetical protein